MYVYMYVRMLTAVYIRCCVAERQAIESAVEASLQECDVDIDDDGGNSGDEGETRRMSTVKAAAATGSGSSAATACSGSASSVAGNTAEGKQRASGKLTLSI